MRLDPIHKKDAPGQEIPDSLAAASDPLREQFKDTHPWLGPTVRSYLTSILFNPSGNGRVLDLGCGNAAVTDYLALDDFYLARFGHPIEFTGIDLAIEDFEFAKSKLAGRANFTPGDAREIQGLVSGTFGLVFIRSPQAEASPNAFNIWRDILEAAKPLLEPTSVVFMLHHHLGGGLVLPRLLVAADYELLINERNEIASHPQNGDGIQLPRRDEWVTLGSI